jgi:hypothetical protein
MSPLAFLFAIISLAASARTQFHGVPVLWLAAAITALLCAAAVLILVRLLIRDGLRLAPAGAA